VGGGGIPIGDPRGAPQEDEGRALVGLACVVPLGAHDHVGVAVPIHVPGPRHARAQPRTRLVRLELGVGGGGIAVGDPRGTPQEDEGRALVGLARVVPVGADDHVVVAVAIDVPGPRDAIAQVRLCLVRFELGGRGAGTPVRDPRGAPQEQEGRSLVRLARVVPRGADDHVGVAVPIDVPSPRHKAQARVRLVRLELGVSRRREQRIDHHGVGGPLVLHHQPQPRGLRHLEARHQRAALRVRRRKLPVGQTPPGSRPEDHPVGVPRCPGALHRQLQRQRSFARRFFFDCEPLLETLPRVRVPLHQTRTPDLHTRTVALHLARLDRRDPVGATQTRERER
jgi:hypothetical protein